MSIRSSRCALTRRRRGRAISGAAPDSTVPVVDAGDCCVSFPRRTSQTARVAFLVRGAWKQATPHAKVEWAIHGTASMPAQESLERETRTGLLKKDVTDSRLEPQQYNLSRGIGGLGRNGVALRLGLLALELQNSGVA